MSEVTRILDAIVQGDPRAAHALLPLVYDELRALAARRLACEAAGQAIDPTDLVHEAYLRLVGPDDGRPWANRGHFFAAAAEAMRRILVEDARRRGAVKHGGGLTRRELDDVPAPADGPREDLLALDEALGKLALAHPDKAELVKLRYFVGLTGAEAAAALGISLATADRHWAYARAWLFHEVGRASGGGGPGPRSPEIPPGLR